MRPAALIACAACVLGSAALPATAATPTANARYEGKTSQGNRFAVHLHTSAAADVDRLSIAWRATECELAQKGTQGTLRLGKLNVSASGRIAARKRTRSKLPRSGNFTGGRQVARQRVRGRFQTTRRIRGVLRVDVRVFNSTGQQIDHCTLKNAIRWRASFIGVTEVGDYELPR